MVASSRSGANPSRLQFHVGQALREALLVGRRGGGGGGGDGQGHRGQGGQGGAAKEAAAEEAAAVVVKEEVVDEVTGYSVDLLCVRGGRSGGGGGTAARRGVAVEVDGPYHFTEPFSRRGHGGGGDGGWEVAPTGPTLLKQRLLRLAGWTVVNVPFYKWERLAAGRTAGRGGGCSGDQVAFLERALREAGAGGLLFFGDAAIPTGTSAIPGGGGDSARLPPLGAPEEAAGLSEEGEDGILPWGIG